MNDVLKSNIDWLITEIEMKQSLVELDFYKQFLNALKAVQCGQARRAEVDFVIQGTSATFAEGYAASLNVRSEELAKDPWIVLRRIGDISAGLTELVAQGKLG